MQISLLHWPPQRLVRESVLNHNLRHPEARLDEEESPWEVIVAVIYAFVRHELTDYDAELAAQTEGAYDEGKRNALAARITARTLRAFPWLKQDPRPFPAQERGLELDDNARRVANLRTLEYHVKQVLADTREAGRKKELRAKLTEIRDRIARFDDLFDRSPLPSARHIRIYSRETETGADYDWFCYDFHLNYLQYVGFSCPVCGAPIMAVKRAVPFGQGRKRYFISCYCVCIATDKLIRRLKMKWWQEVLEEHGLLETPSPKEK